MMIADEPAIIAVIPTATSANIVDVIVQEQEDQVARVEKVHVSDYKPWELGTNCASAVDGICVSHTANGDIWQSWVETGAACISEWPFGLRFKLPDGRIFTCVDRGGAIRRGYSPSWMEADNLPWVDLLTTSPLSFGSVVEVEILK